MQAVVVIALMLFIIALLIAFWKTVVAVLLLCAILPLLYYSIRKYIYLTNEPRAKILAERGDYHAALDALSNIPKPGISWMDAIRTEHLDEALQVLNQRNATLGNEVNQLMQHAERTSRSTGSLENRLQVARETGHNEDFDKALIARLAELYGMTRHE